MAKSCDVLIVGAGLAGLNAAIYLQQKGVDVLIVEASDRPGGRVTSDVIDGYICDRGFQLINAAYPALKELNVISEIDFLVAPRIIDVALGISRHAIGDPRKLPFSALDRATGTIPEKISLLIFLISRVKSGVSLGQALRKCGTTYDRVLRPFLEGVFLTDPDNVDAKYGQLILKSFVTGSIGIPRLGVGQLSKALAHRVPTIDYNVRVDQIHNGIANTSNGTYQAKKILIATDATTATQLLQLSQVPSMTGCITWYHSSSDNPSGTGHLIVDGRRLGPVINSIVISDISSSYAPVGAHLISSTTALNVSESDVRRHLALIWGVQTHTWQLIAKYEIASALPVQGVGRALSQSFKISKNLFVAGDHRTVPSQQGALFSGKVAAQLILD